MHITELVLDDFKSFGRKTRIPFYEDFTVITGPNGSGKSNIIDAVLFTLGLARTRGIRAEKLTDLIYNPGHEDDTDEPGPREASVTVVLDNADGTLDRSQVVNAAGTEDIGDVDEISVKRRVKETEDNYYSYYYLNDRSVNLSDIRELLAQAGVTPEGYNVVMQGDVTEIINMTATERRTIVDEIAGVAEFDAKKQDAFEELSLVQERIDEADLRIEEKTTRLNQLEDERETALAYQSLRDEKAEYESHLKAAELEQKRTALTRTEKRIEAKEQELADRRATLEKHRSEVDRLETDLNDLTREIERKGEDEQLRIKGEIEELKGEIGRLEATIENQEETVEDAEQERREAFVSLDNKTEELDDLENEIRSIKVEKASVKSDIEAKKADLRAVETEIENVDTAFDELKEILAERKERLEERKTERNDAQRKNDRLLDEARRRSTRISEARSELETAHERLPALNAELSDLRGELDRAKRNREKIETAIEELRAEKADLNDDLDGIKEGLRTKRNEYAELEARADRDGDDSWPRSVTTALNGGIDGVHGAVGQLGSVDPEWATACETAAGGRLANVVVDDDGVGAACIDHLKSRSAGRATFLPLTEMDRRGLPSKPSHPGVVDFARNLVDYDDRYAGVFSYVLGSTLVVENMNAARDLMGDYRLVTLDGDLAEKSGAMTGGSGGGSRYSFTKSGKGKLERLAEEIERLEDDRRTVREEIRDVESRLDDARDRKADATERVREVETEIENAEADRAETEAEIEALEDELDDLRGERDEVDAEMGELEERIEELDAEIEGIEAEIEELETELADSRIPELTDRKESIEADIAALEDRMDDLDAQLGQTQVEVEYAEEAVDDLEATIEAAKKRKREATDRIEESAAEVERHKATLGEKRAAIEELEDELAGLKADRAELQTDLREAKSGRDDQRERVAEVENGLDDLAEEAERLEWEIDELETEVGAYDPEEVPDHETVEENVARLESEMDALEPVNMLAIDEYDEVAAELDDLQERRDTLVDERDAIEERIEGYEQRKTETFMTAFEAIDDHFRDIFERLSAGTGELHLENETDPFDGGLTMKAQPGDKPVQRLDAMSGGEKSLTALAFIFAIQRHNPAPFYALDEVDAFLDAANAERVGEMVDDLADEAQFVVVSHRSALLDRSERAIGVTMQGDNVSAVTGIQLDDTPEATADD
ncbi:chromosome segregation protein SMC [Haloplanus sp.]|uniref:chromosome segregation protein SMC n=1 Tax=Haloplanus sp. TaxID=1961696 RepID=UPI00263A2A82|nr:chromosome segregation protein SMC [Haloplanus sp.]